MFNWLKSFQLEKISFLIGFFTATIFWLIILQIKKWLPEFKTSLLNIQTKLRKNQTSGLSIAVKKDALRRAQSNHLGNKLFSLHEILIEPELEISGNQQISQETGLFESEVSEIVPFVPEYSQINRNFFLPRLKITDIIQKENKIAIYGLPGTGKSVCLAHLVTNLAENNSSCGNQCGKTPFYIHIHDTNLLNNPEQTINEVIFKSISQYIPNFHLPQLAKFIQVELNTNNAIVVIDGIDELFKNEADSVFEYLGKISKQKPELKIIITLSPYYFGNIEKYNFLTFQISPFANRHIDALNQKWTDLWYKNNISEENSNPSYINQKLIRNWVNLSIPNYTPLEYTLLIWGALSGDLQGYDTHSLYRSHIQRIFQNDSTFDNLGVIANKFLTEKKSYVSIKGFDNGIISSLHEWGIISKNNDFISFEHLDFLGYLSGLLQSEIKFENSLAKISRNPIEFSSASFLSSQERLNPWVEEFIQDDGSTINFNLFLVIPWLRHTNTKSAWRISLFKNIFKNLSISNLPFCIKYRYLAAFMFSNDPSFGVIIKQLMANNAGDYKKLGLLSIGSIANNEAILQEISNEIFNLKNELLKYAVIILSTKSNESNLDTLARLLLSADENIRKLVAQCLANMEENAIDLLKDAITMDDILVRRSAIYGFVLINDIWVYEILKKMTVEDSQWIIRDMANQALEYLNTNNAYKSPDKKQIHEMDWIIRFAANQNLGISPDSNPTNIFKSILTSGSLLEKRKTLEIIPDYFDYSIYPIILNLVFSDNMQLSNDATVAIWKIFQNGFDFPSTISEQI